MAGTTINKSTPEKTSGTFRYILMGGFGIAALVIGILTYNFVRDFVGGWRITSLPGLTVNGNPGVTNPEGTGEEDPAAGELPSRAPAAVNMPAPWDGASRVSVLVMGLDYRDWESGEGPPRTDTMILLTIDPVAKTAGMLSIPRDLWVDIPGWGYGRINQAYQFGEGARLPDGGAGLAMKTVESLLGVPIDYYAQIDFNAFVRLIDEIGGVKVDVPAEIKVDILGDGQNTIKKVKAGRQTMPGDLALAYARARYTEGGDFDRAQRQQQVIFGIRDRMLSPDAIPLMLTKAPTLYNELSSGINTNMGFEQAIRLGLLALEIQDENIKKGIISAEQVNFAKSPDGQDVLKPLPEKIRLLRDEVFTAEGPIGPSSDTEDLLGLVKEENATVAIFNGTLTGGLAGTTAEYFRGQGLNIPGEYVSDGVSSFYSQIIDHSGNPYTMSYLVNVMGISTNNIYIKYDPTNPIDIEVILGNDWANINPMP